jgi:hypothetical protein
MLKTLPIRNARVCAHMVQIEKKHVVKAYLHFGCLLHVAHAKVTKLPISLLMYFIKTIHGSDFHT